MQVAETALILNAVTDGVFNASLPDFISGGGSPGTDGSLKVTLPELFGAGPGGFGGNYHSSYGKGFSALGKVAKKNLQDNGVKMAMQVIGIPIAFRIAGSLLKKPRRQMNSIMKQIGLDGVKV
jgi:hypothetical protein